MNKLIFKHLATLGPIGYLPAPGTCASIVGFFCVYLVSFLNLSLLSYFILVIFLTSLGAQIISQAIQFFDTSDPQPIVIDEFVGCFYVFLFKPITPEGIVLGFVLFRFFDITKIFGIRSLEDEFQELGILLDDLAAALCANMTTTALLWFINF